MDLVVSISTQHSEMLQQNPWAARLIEDSVTFDDWKKHLREFELLNNRFISFIQTSESQNQDSYSMPQMWLFSRPSHPVPVCVLESEFELMMCHRDKVVFDIDLVKILRKQFPKAHVLTLHEPFAGQWKEVAQGMGYLDHVSLTTHLYKVDQDTLTKIEEPQFYFKKIERLDREVYRSIEGFIRETMRKRVKKDEVNRSYQKHCFYGLFHRGRLLSIAAKTRSIPNARCISYVYTPPELRGRAYARVLVSQMAQDILEKESVQTVFLYADQSNPSSNRLYQNLGFQKVCGCVTFVS